MSPSSSSLCGCYCCPPTSHRPFFSMTDLQVFGSSSPVSPGWALSQAKRSRSRERMLLGHWRRPPLLWQVQSEMSLLEMESGHWIPGRGLPGARFPLVISRLVQAAGARLQSSSPGSCPSHASTYPRAFLSSPWKESFPSRPRQVRGPGLIRTSVLILEQALPGFANCFPFSREPKTKRYS